MAVKEDVLFAGRFMCNFALVIFRLALGFVKFLAGVVLSVSCVLADRKVDTQSYFESRPELSDSAHLTLLKKSPFTSLWIRKPKMSDVWRRACSSSTSRFFCFAAENTSHSLRYFLVRGRSLTSK